jgi:predicted nucleic acid-binding protein
MTPWFADTFFFLALLNPADEAHGRAVAARDEDHLIVTTDFVLLELADHMCDQRHRAAFVRTYALLIANRATKIVPVSDDLLRRGRTFYTSRGDKDWSLTDCTSFVVMRERRLTDALTADHHFEQAGFNALLK